MFKSIPLKSQATRLGELLSRHGVQLSRAEKLEALAFVHGAVNWQTLRSSMELSEITESEVVVAVEPAPSSPYAFGSTADAVLEVSPQANWTQVVGDVDTPYLTLQGQTERQFATSVFEAPRLASERQESSLWVVNSTGVPRLIAYRHADVQAQTPQVPVFPIGADGLEHAQAHWNFQHDLSDSGGRFNRAQMERKPYLADGTFSVDDWNLCIELLLYAESSYIGNLDGQLGVYFEQEFTSAESDAESDEDSAEYPTFEARVRDLQRRYSDLAQEYPEVRFAVCADPDLTWAGRPTLWAFFPVHALTLLEAKQLGDQISNRAYGTVGGAVTIL